MPLIKELEMVLELAKDLPVEHQRLLARHIAWVVERHDNRRTMTREELAHLDELLLRERVRKLFGQD